MSRLGANLISSLSVLLLLGAGGWLLAKRRLVADIAAVRAAPDPELIRLRAENRQLKERLRAPAAASASPSVAITSPASVAPPARRARVVSDLVYSGLLGDMSWPQPPRNSLAAGIADFAEMIGLSEPETTALQRAAEVGTEEFGVALLAHATVQREGTMVTVAVKDEPAVRAAYDRMLASFAAVLGPENYGYYQSLGAKAGIAKLFDRWGLGGTTLMVSHSTSIPDAFYPPRLDAQGNPLPSPFRGGRGRPDGQLSYYYTQIKPGQQGGGGASGTNSIENIGTNVGPLTALIPPDL